MVHLRLTVVGTACGSVLDAAVNKWMHQNLAMIDSQNKTSKAVSPSAFGCWRVAEKIICSWQAGLLL